MSSFSERSSFYASEVRQAYLHADAKTRWELDRLYSAYPMYPLPKTYQEALERLDHNLDIAGL